MKPLDTYPTTLTDAKAFNHQYKDGQPIGHMVVLADFACDLERKLALAREALEIIQRDCEDVDADDDWKIKYAIVSAKEAIAATAPTP